MVVFFTSTAADPPPIIFMGKDKVENEDLIRYGLPSDLWFHVDKLSSAHVYLRLPEACQWGSWEAGLPESVQQEMGQLVKANSIEGNKRSQVTVIYTPHSNLKKTGDMATGSVSFHNDRLVKRVFVGARDNAVVNRLNRSKVVREVDHEEERIARQRVEGKLKAQKANELKNARLASERERAHAKSQQGYASLFTEEAGYGVADRPGLGPRFSSKREKAEAEAAAAGKAPGGVKGKGEARGTRGEQKVAMDLIGVGGGGGGEDEGSEDEGEGSQDDFW